MRISDKVRAYINTIKIGEEFTTYQISNAIGCDTGKFASMLAVLAKKGHINKVRKERIAGKCGVMAIWARVNELPLFLGARGKPIEQINKKQVETVSINLSDPWRLFAFGGRLT